MELSDSPGAISFALELRHSFVIRHSSFVIPARRMNFGSPNFLWLLLLLAPLLALLVWSWRVRQRLLTRFIGARLLASLTAGVSRQRQKVRLLLFLIAIASLIFSFARPQLGFSLEESKQAGLDVVVA